MRPARLTATSTAAAEELVLPEPGCAVNQEWSGVTVHWSGPPAGLPLVRVSVWCVVTLLKASAAGLTWRVGAKVPSTRERMSKLPAPASCSQTARKLLACVLVPTSGRTRLVAPDERLTLA